MEVQGADTAPGGVDYSLYLSLTQCPDCTCIAIGRAHGVDGATGLHVSVGICLSSQIRGLWLLFQLGNLGFMFS